MTKKQKIIFIVTAMVLLLFFCIWQIKKIDQYSSQHFLTPTLINGVDCSRMTLEEAKEALTDHWNQKDFVIKKGKKTLGVIKALDLTYDIEKPLEDAMNKPLYQRVWHYIAKPQEVVTLKMTADSATEKVEKQIQSMEFLDRKYKVKTKDAYVDLSNRKFKIVKEVQGDNTDKARFKETVLKNIAEGRFSLEYKKEDYYQIPKVLSTDKKLLEYREYCRKNFSQKITYCFYNRKYTLTPADLESMLEIKDGKRQIKEKAVRRFVAKLAASYDTLGTSRTFRTSYKGTIKVSGGSYGYLIDQNREQSALIKNLKSGKDVSRKPVYSQVPYYSGGGNNDIGSSYVEIDIANQHLWLYVNGRVLVDCPVVTGSLSGGYATPRGVYYLVYKAQDVKLRGRNSDGTKYESPVKYWMPFFRDYGIHDASWRSTFGGSIYRSSGSHGCVNMPPGAAAVVYANISAGYPIVVH